MGAIIFHTGRYTLQDLTRFEEFGVWKSSNDRKMARNSYACFLRPPQSNPITHLRLLSHSFGPQLPHDGLAGIYTPLEFPKPFPFEDGFLRGPLLFVMNCGQSIAIIPTQTLHKPIEVSSSDSAHRIRAITFLIEIRPSTKYFVLSKVESPPHTISARVKVQTSPNSKIVIAKWVDTKGWYALARMRIPFLICLTLKGWIASLEYMKRPEKMVTAATV
ncbi:MAG: hypothetical protein QM706_15025 [Nitrospira sp.]